MEGSLLALDVPIRSQLDGSEYQAANCGPASLGMVLDAFGVEATTPQLRNLANRLQGTYDRGTGIALGYLGDIAADAGLRPLGLRDGASYHRWSVDQVRDEVRRGHPVITLVRLRELPDYAGTRSDTDHYVVVVGLDGERLLVNDPARPREQGFRRPLTPAQLERAWDASSIPRQALAIGAPIGLAELGFPVPGAGAGPGMSLSAVGADQVDGSSSVQMALPAQPLPLVQPGQVLPPAQGQGGSSAPPFVVIVTPVIVVNVNIPASAFPSQPQPIPVPLPTRDRWARPPGFASEFSPVVAPVGLESPAMPSARVPADEPTPARWARPIPGEPPALVLGESGSVPQENTLRWIARFAMLSAGVLGLRWAMR